MTRAVQHGRWLGFLARRSQALGAAIAISAAAGCAPDSTPVGPVGADRSAAPAATTQVTVPDGAWAILQRHCLWCHTAQYPTGGFDFTTRTQTLATVRAIGLGVQQEMAPLVYQLPLAEKRLLLDWVEQTTSALPVVVIPATYRWTLDEVIAGVPDGQSPPGFAFVLEDGWIDPAPWTVQRYTDRFGIAYRGIGLDQQHFVDEAVFSSSRNPSSYFVFKGVPWHGRFHDMRMEGDIRVNRWMSVGMQAEDMEPTGRKNRHYVRLQFDRDAMSLRSAPTKFETWPWGGSGATPGADEKLIGTVNASGFYQRSSEWLHFVFTATRVAGGTRWTALVTCRGTGAVIASLQAMEPSSEPLSGTFFLHAYGVGNKRNWANLVFDAKIDQDLGTPPPPPPPPGHPGRGSILPGDAIQLTD